MKENLDLPENKEDSGKRFIPVWKKFGSLGCTPIYWGIIRRLGIKVNCYLVDSQILRHLIVEFGKNWMVSAVD